MSQEDLDVVMMEDFGPDMDLLDGLLDGGLDSMIDWCKLEPSLSMSFGPQSPESPLGPELPSLPMLGSIGAPSPEPPSHHLLSKQPQLSPQAQEVPRLAVTTSPLQTQAILTRSHLGENALPQHQIRFTTTTTPFTGFGIPFTPAMFGNAVILPQLQLTVVDNQGQVGKKSSKLPVKRLEKGGAPPRKKEPTNRRSSHNAIERRYRSSINDKILELKNLVCAPSEPNEKVHKAAILRSSIDSIRHLQNTNSRLDKENRELKRSMTQCPTCRNDTTLRGILTASASSPATPPPTEGESTDSSNPPSPNEDIKPGSKGLLTKSPLLLFSLVTGLFLINPIAHHSQDDIGLTHRSRVERSVEGMGADEDVSSDIDWHALWAPRIFTILVNLFLFSVLYWMCGRVGQKSSRGKHSIEQLRLLRGKDWAKASSARNKALHIQAVLAQFETLPGNSLSRFLAILVNLGKMPFALRRSPGKNAEVNEELSLLHLEWGACGGGGLFPSLRAINLSPSNKQIILRSLIQAKSKLLLKFLLLWTDFSSDDTFGTPEGLFFLQNHITRGPGSADFLPSQSDELGQMVTNFREDMLDFGMQELLHRGTGRHLFRLVLASAKKDQLAQFWAAIMWAEAESIAGGGRSETLKRLCRLVDSLWRSLKGREERGLLTAVYKAHMGKRTLMMDGVPEKYILDEASSYLRDSINTATEKPRRLTQLAWCLAAEWILECRLSLWEEHKESREFSSDLDRLRSLTHFVPGVLPSVYLYEASQRLMNYAAPGRTQQLLDASLREVRLTGRALICKDSRDMGLVATSSREDGAPCHLGKRKKEPNLVREKRKAFALYLKCKYLPSQVITCPAEKAGMLKEALQALEKVGQKKKIQACLEMIRALGQSITLH